MAVITIPKYTGMEAGKIVDARYNAYQYEEYLNARSQGAGATQAVVAGTGTNGAGTSIKDHPGLRRLTVAATGADHAGEHSNIQLFHNKTVGSWFRLVIQLTQLSTAGEEFEVVAGFLNDVTRAVALAPTHGYYFRYKRTVSTEWLRCSINGGTETATATGIAVATGWVRLEAYLNPGGTSIDYYINGVSAGSVTTNIMDETDATYILNSMTKTAGVGAVTGDIDAAEWLVGVNR